MDHIKNIRKEFLLDELSRFVSFNSGIIQMTDFNEDCLLQVPSAISMIGNGSFRLGFGLDLDITTAMIKSLAEALERYALICDKVNDVVLHKKSVKELESTGYSCFCPDYDVYEDFVYKNPRFVRMTPTLKTDWVMAKRLSDNKMIWLPASLMYCFPNLSVNILKFSTSNGMSCSFFDSAVERSLLELIERDTFLYMWLAKSPGEEILFDKVHYQPLAELLDILDCKRKQIKVIYKYTDTRIPCVFVIFKGKKKYNEAAFFISGSADPDIERGCYRALLEFSSAYNMFCVEPRYKDKIKEIKDSRRDFVIKTFFERTAFYTMYENFHKCRFLFNTRGYKKLSELSERWVEIRGTKKENLLKSCLKGKEVFFKDVTPKEMEKSDVRVVRSYSPDLLDFEGREDRLYNSVVKKKRIDMIDRVFNKKTEFLNSDPHCYP